MKKTRERYRLWWRWMPNRWWDYLLPVDIGFDKSVEWAWLFWIIVKIKRPLSTPPAGTDSSAG